MSGTNEKLLSDFLRIVETTRDARFQANLRLNNRQKISNYVISLLSLAVIFLSLIPMFHETSDVEDRILLTSSIVLSVFVIITTLIDGSSNFYHRGELLHRCARGAGDVFLQLRMLDPSATDFQTRFEQLKDRYQKVLDDCPVNHDNVDYRKARIQKPNNFIGKHYSSIKFFREAQIANDKIFHVLSENSWLAPHVIAVAVIAAVVVEILR